jgi:hypothetical protein
MEDKNMSDERTPLTQKYASSPPSSQFYFMNKTPPNENDNGDTPLPEGTTSADFKPRQVNHNHNHNQSTGSMRSRSHSTSTPHTVLENLTATLRNSLPGWGRGSNKTNPNSRKSPQMTFNIKQRRVPIKVEPKAIIAFADEEDEESNSKIYGLTILPVAISFIVYALFQYTKRAAMIKRKDPGPYEDLIGPVVLSLMLMLCIFMNFFVKIMEVFKDGGS